MERKFGCRRRVVFAIIFLSILIYCILYLNERLTNAASPSQRNLLGEAKLESNQHSINQPGVKQGRTGPFMHSVISLMSPSLSPESDDASTNQRNTDSKEILLTDGNEVDCDLWNIPKRWKGEKNPKIVLDPTRFLYPGLYGGPNNQITGLKEAVFLSIRLNRTLALPIFRSHVTNLRRRLSPFQMFDVERLCSFISCITVEELSELCEGSFDVAFQGSKEVGWGKLELFEEQTNMRIFREKYRSIPYVRQIYFDQELSAADTPQNKRKYENVKEYESPASCAIFLSLFGTFSATNKQPVPSYVFNADQVLTVSDKILGCAINNATRNPPCTVQAAASYIQEMTKGSKFIGLHWRYDKSDWIRSCRNPHSENTRIFCDNYEKMKPRHLVNSFYRLYEKSAFANVETFIYMAAPPNEKEFKKEFYNQLTNRNQLIVTPSSTLEEFLATKFQSCWSNNEWSDKIADIVSQSEMEILVQSSWLFYSPHSTWSGNVRQARSATRHENNLEVFESNIADLVMKEINREYSR